MQLSNKLELKNRKKVVTNGGLPQVKRKAHHKTVFVQLAGKNSEDADLGRLIMVSRPLNVLVNPRMQTYHD